MLIGLDKMKAAIWQIFSEVIKPVNTISLTKNHSRLSDRERYNFYEEIIDSIRPLLKKGIKSIILANPRNTDYNEAFQNHIEKHHMWLTNGSKNAGLTIGNLVGHANTLKTVKKLTQKKEFNQLLEKITKKESVEILDDLNKRLSKIPQGEVVLYSLKEIEKLTYSNWMKVKRKPVYVILTDKFLQTHKQKQRVYRLLQILRNKNITTKIVEADSAAGQRVKQFGGIICFTDTI